jgi:hypothetical protein
VDENSFWPSMQKEVNLNILHHQEEKEMTKFFHINIQVKNTKIDVMFDSGSHVKLIEMDLVNKLGLDVYNHPIPCPLGWVNKDEDIRVTKQCKIEFLVSVDFIDEVELNVVPLDVCGVMFGRPYMYMRDFIFIRRTNQCCLILIKDRILHHQHTQRKIKNFTGKCQSS